MPPRGTSAAGTTATAKTAKPPALRSSALRTIEAGYADALLRYAEVMHKGGLGGKDATRPEAIAAKIEVGRDLGLPPTTAIANVMIVNGKPTIWGDAGMALIRASGLMESCEESYSGDPAMDEKGRPTNRDFAAIFSIKRIGTESARVSRFSVADAIQAGLWNKAGPWQQYTVRMLMWRAKSFACRDEFQDVLCGCVFTEEAMDYPGVRIGEVVSVETVTVEAKVNADGTTEIKAEESAKIDVSAAGGVAPNPNAKTEPATVAKSGPVTDEQLQRLAELRDEEFKARSLHSDDNESKSRIWLDYLSHYFVDSARKLTAAQADELIATLEKKHEFPPLDKAGMKKTA